MSFTNWAVPQGQTVRVSPKMLALLDETLLDRNGRIKLLPASTYAAIPYQDLRIWANMRSQYGLPTAELITWLKERIAGRKAIEIGPVMAISESTWASQ